MTDGMIGAPSDATQESTMYRYGNVYYQTLADLLDFAL